MLNKHYISRYNVHNRHLRIERLEERRVLATVVVDFAVDFFDAVASWNIESKKVSGTKLPVGLG
ncbi:hypothetical protein [Adhaeretor mobilis]|uniref:Uncharacterized protein n=1 Tax=Adhaeretor mobilis TaxID=1930276 RepID=A0A517N272_9BACT|nr:hypothetical protein [Adhaeretor mobilis]QDT01221.1 hypothetical protein HG15A2_45630 [Adhaeretor mobilis]